MRNKFWILKGWSSMTAMEKPVLRGRNLGAWVSQLTMVILHFGHKERHASFEI